MNLTHEYRGEILENIHPGRICIVAEDGHVKHALGDMKSPAYYRSSSKPFQVIPVLEMGLDAKYGLQEEEIAIMAGSHAGEPRHLKVILSLLEKTGFSEDELIMLETQPANPSAKEARIREGLPPRKALHNCAGKHIAAMMLAKELMGDYRDYWRPDSAAQRLIRKAVARMAQTDPEKILVGIDGCGVPVYAVTLPQMADSYLRLTCPERIEEESLRNGAFKITAVMHAHPGMVRGEGYLCSLLNKDPNIVAKGGAQGVYCFGLGRERLGIALKMDDGEEGSWPVVISEILKQLHYGEAQTIHMLDQLGPRVRRNDAGIPIGRMEPCFTLK